MNEAVADNATDSSNDAGAKGAPVDTTSPEATDSWVQEDGSSESSDNGSSNSDNGLLANAGSEGAVAPDASEAADPSQAPSTVTRPDYIPEQFWDAKGGKVNDKAIAKGYNDLRKQFNKMNQENGKAPEDFAAYLEDFKPPNRGRARGEQKEGEELTRYGELKADDPVFQALAKAAKNANMSTGHFNDFVADIMTDLHGILPEPFNPQKEMEMLGDNAAGLIDVVSKWTNNGVQNGMFNETEYNLITQWGSSAAGVQLLNKLRMETGEKPIPVKLNGGVGTGQKTPDECRALMSETNEKGEVLYYQESPAGKAHREMVDKAFEQTFGTEAA